MRNRSPFQYSTSNIESDSGNTDYTYRNSNNNTTKSCDRMNETMSYESGLIEVASNALLQPTRINVEQHNNNTCTTTRFSLFQVNQTKQNENCNITSIRSSMGFKNLRWTRNQHQRHHCKRRFDNHHDKSTPHVLKLIMIFMEITFVAALLSLATTRMIPLVLDWKRHNKYINQVHNQIKNHPPSAIVIGSGLAGLSATLRILDRGGYVILIEKNSYLGGNSNKASSGINSCCNSTPWDSVHDSIDLFMNDTTKSAGTLARQPLIETLVQNSDNAVQWLQQRVGVDLSKVAQLGGHSIPRTHRPVSGMVGAEIIFKMQQIIRSYETQGRVLVLVNTQVTRLLLNEKDDDTTTTTTTTTPYKGGNKYSRHSQRYSSTIAGVECTWNDQNSRTNKVLSTTFQIHAPSIIVATGGFAADRNSTANHQHSYLKQYRPDLLSMPTTAGSFSTGDGISLATKLSLSFDDDTASSPSSTSSVNKINWNTKSNFKPAAVIDMDQVQIHPTGFIDPTNPTSISKTLAAEVLRGVGGILLNQMGQRFCNELGTRDYISEKMLKSTHDNRTFFLLLSSNSARGAQNHVDRYVNQGVLHKIHGVTELAKWMGISKNVVQLTLDEYYNGDARRDQPDRFGKIYFPGISEEKMVFDDNTLDSTNFYIGIVTPVVHYCMGGIHISTSGQVLDIDGQVINGLYAAGEVTGGVHGKNRLGGNSLLECTVFGSIIGENIPLRRPAISSTGIKNDHDRASPFLRIVLRSELQRHTTISDCWVAINGIVYDFTSIAQTHPAGPEQIYSMAGTDATSNFVLMHNLDVLNRPSIVQARVGALYRDIVTDVSSDTEIHKNDLALPKITMKELALHNTLASCWIAIQGIVYDLTEFSQKNHPAGSGPIQKLAGTDGTVIFKTVHNIHMLDAFTKNRVAILDNHQEAISSLDVRTNNSEKSVLREELHKHHSPADCWVAVNGYVYELTNFAKYHKGGEYQIYKNCGKDATKTFNVIHKTGTMDAFAANRVGIFHDP